MKIYGYPLLHRAFLAEFKLVFSMYGSCEGIFCLGNLCLPSVSGSNGDKLMTKTELLIIFDQRYHSCVLFALTIMHYFLRSGHISVSLLSKLGACTYTYNVKYALNTIGRGFIVSID